MWRSSSRCATATCRCRRCAGDTTAFTLDIEAAADGDARRPQLLARYTLRQPQRPAQPLHAAAGAAAVAGQPAAAVPDDAGRRQPGAAAGWADGALQVNGRVAALRGRAAATAAPFVATAFGSARWPPTPALDALETRSGTRRRCCCPHRAARRASAQTIGWTAPLAGSRRSPIADAGARRALRRGRAHDWRERLNRLQLTAARRRRSRSPTRCARRSRRCSFARRPGAATRHALVRAHLDPRRRDDGRGLLRLGEIDAAREFIDWFAPLHLRLGQGAVLRRRARRRSGGRERQPRPVPLRGGRAMAPHARPRTARRATGRRCSARARYMETLAPERAYDGEPRTASAPPASASMPPSISHEGYSDKPAHSYWDDFWALRGYKDAVLIARRARPRARRAALVARWRDEFERELAASIPRPRALHRIDFIPGAADRGDFDAPRRRSR